MRFNAKSIIVAGSLAALSLSMIGCQGQYPGGSAYMPANSGTQPAVKPGGGLEPAMKGDIDSGCGHKLHIVLAGIVNCRFHEKGYGNGTFTVSDNEQGIIAVTPSSGTKSTVFTIVGLLIGSGDLVWKDTKGNQYKIQVTVTL